MFGVIKSKHHAKISMKQEMKLAEFNLIPRSEKLHSALQVSNSGH